MLPYAHIEFHGLGSDSKHRALWARLALKRMICGVVGLILVLWPVLARPADRAELEEIIDEARLSFLHFVGDPALPWFRRLVQNARVVFIAPQVKSVSYLFGATWGTGVLLVRNSTTGEWSEPAFYSVMGPNVGFQVGALRSEVVAVATDDHATSKMLEGAFTLDLNTALGVGRMGGGVGGSLEMTTGSGFVSLATATGAYAGVALGATLVSRDDDANALYYGEAVALSDLQDGRVREWYSERLMRTVDKFTVKDQARSP